MVRITVDEELKQKLFAAGDVVELVDESGRLLGTVLPKAKDSGRGAAPAAPDLSDEGLDRLSNVEGPTTTSEEFLARLRSKL